MVSNRRSVQQMSQWITSLVTGCHLSKDEASNEFRWMLERILCRRFQSRWPTQFSPHSIYLYGSDLSVSLKSLSVSEFNLLNRWIHDRSSLQKPLQYILGTQDFCELSFKVRPPTLIPRWETEEWVMKLFQCIQNDIHSFQRWRRPLKILDLCSGSGCIGLTLAHHLSKVNPWLDLQIHAMDISSRAVSLTRINQKRLKIPLSRLKICQGDVLQDRDLNGLIANAGSLFDLIVSNPPYISYTEFNALDPSVRNWEDSRALIAEKSGLALHERIIQKSLDGSLLSDSIQFVRTPRVTLEFGGSHQTENLENLVVSMRQRRKLRTEIWKDLANKDRVLALYF